MDALFYIGSGVLIFALGALTQYLAVRIAIKKDWEDYNKKINIERKNVIELEQEKRWLAEEMSK